METREYRTIDKTTWPPGPWQAEPDKVQWQDPATGLPCLIVRNSSGALCGYVGVAEDHPLAGVEYGALYDRGLSMDCHGGLTYSEHCAPSTDEARGICHLPAPGEPDHVWWFGFDCAHSGDMSPGYYRDDASSFIRGIYRDIGLSRDQYRTVEYVRREVTGLAAQIDAAKHAGRGEGGQ